MTAYDKLLTEADNEGIIVKEAPLQSGDGRCKGRRIAIREDIPTLARKADILAEELGHYYTTVGDIKNQEDAEHRKQERKSRLWAYNRRIGLMGLINAFKAHCSTSYEIASHLEVSEELLLEALDCYRSVYGESGEVVDNYIIKFEPYLQVYEIFAF